MSEFQLLYQIGLVYLSLSSNKATQLAQNVSEFNRNLLKKGKQYTHQQVGQNPTIFQRCFSEFHKTRPRSIKFLKLRSPGATTEMFP